jgi:hypothetical protein
MGWKFGLSPLNPLHKVFFLGLMYFSWNQSADQGPSMEINDQTKPNNALLTVLTGSAHSPQLFRVEWVTIRSTCYNVESSYLKALVWFLC